MKKLLLILSAALMFAFVGCESLGDDNVVGGSYSISGAIQKGPFVQGSTITIQPLNSNLKPIGQMYTTQTTNDAGMFEMDGVNSKYAEIIATGYYYDEVEGKISASPLTLRSIADLKDGTQTNVNLLTSLTYNRIKNLVTNEGKDIAKAQEQAEKELFTALGIPAELQPKVSCGAMNIANNGEGDGLLLFISAVLQEGRTVGELSEYISKFSADLADDGRVEQTLLDKFNLDGQHLLRFEGRIKENLEARYKSLGIECNVPEFSQYLPYLKTNQEPYFVIPFTYYENKNDAIPNHPEWTVNLNSIEEGFVFISDVEYLGYGYNKGYGEIYLSAAPTVINACRCDVLRTIDIPDGVVEIGDTAFRDQMAMERIEIPDSVIKIGESAFGYCESLESITIPNSVTSIGLGAFQNCSSLTSVTIPDSVTSIGSHTFYFCESIENVVIGKGFTEIGNCMFQACTSLKRVTIPDNITSIGIYAFEYCTSLESVVISERVVGINHGAFQTCTSLESIHIPDSVEWIEEAAFRDCTSLESATIGNGCTTIWVQAFYGCSSLTNVTIGNSVGLIGEQAFYDCTSLVNITIPESVYHVGKDAFMGCQNLASVTIEGNGCTTIDFRAFYCCTRLTNLTIGDGVSTIGDLAFGDCWSLAKVTIPEGVEWIGEVAFAHSGLTEVTLPSTLKTLGNGAFCANVNLTSVYCKATTPPSVTPSGVLWRCFMDCAMSDTPLVIYVPTESVDAYKTAEGWSEYADDIVGYDFD